MSWASDRSRPDVALPTGNLTFLITDLEDSSAAWERRPKSTRVALHYHDQTVSELTRACSGVLIKHTGDGMKAVFAAADSAIAAAVEMQKRFQQEKWDGAERMRVRIGLHSGDAAPDGDDYYGGVINRAARVADIANGDQIAVTGAVVAEVAHKTSSPVSFIDCGFAQLKGCGQERIFLVEAEGLSGDDRPLRIRRALAGSALPPEAGRLIARENELERVCGFLNHRRLVSIVGLGGIGKTRLAVAVARRHSSNFADGVVYCPLGPISSGTEGTGVLVALAQALGARRQPGHDLSWSIVNFVEGREVLIVLDNCEHVKSAVTSIVDRLLSVEGPTVLLTSREPLDLPGEQRVGLGPLETHTAGVELLVERALERDPEFDSTYHQETLQAISQRLDGIPLALELAAARLRILTPDRLLAGLAEGDRFLGSSARGVSPLHATVAWSVDQLDERQQSVLEGLCIFSGGFTLDAVSAVLSIDDEMTLLDDLTHLVELSLVRNQPSQGEIRFSMLETIRQFGLKRLHQREVDCIGGGVDDTALRDAHARYYAQLATQCGRNLMTAAEAEIWTQVDVENGNIRTAFEHLFAVERYDEAAQIVVDLAWFATLSMRMEMFGWARRLLEIPALAEVPELWAVRSIGEYLSASSECNVSALRSLELDESDPTGLARTTLASIGLNNTFDAELSGAATAGMLAHPSERSMEQQIVGLGLRSFHLCLRQPGPKAGVPAREAMAKAEETGSASAMAIGYWAQAVANLVIDWPKAEESIRRGLAMTESLSSNHLISHLLNGLVVHFSSLTGPVHEAAEITASEIRSTMEKHYLVGASHLLGGASVVLSRAGRTDDGAALLGAMINNGHRPRREIRTTVEAALQGRAGAAIDAGRGWSINEAGERAVQWLDEVSSDVTER